MRVWDLATGQARTLEGHGGWVLAVAVTPDGRTAVSGSRDGTVRVWDLASGQARTLEGHGGWVIAVAVTPDGRTAVSGSTDGTVRVWDLASGQARTLEGHGGAVDAVAVTADGRTAVSGSEYGMVVQVWDLTTGKARTLAGHGGWVNAVAVTPDGLHSHLGFVRRHGAGLGPGHRPRPRHIPRRCRRDFVRGVRRWPNCRRRRRVRACPLPATGGTLSPADRRHRDDHLLLTNTSWTRGSLSVSIRVANPVRRHEPSPDAFGGTYLPCSLRASRGQMPGCVSDFHARTST